MVKRVKVVAVRTAVAAGVLQALGILPAAHGGELPIPCIAGSCGPAVSGFLKSGQATATAVGNTLTVNQTTDRAILNWRSFNVDADGKVIFNQPDSQSIALNRIFQDSPSRIFGAVEANGQIYLVNPNGVLFGAGARVKTAGLVASTLNISDEVFATGLVAPELALNRRPSLESDGREFVKDANGDDVLGADGKPIEIKLRVEQGAQISTTGKGGRVVLASRTVENAGRIDTPDGQTLIAAGEKVYLQPSGDASLRGLLVEVDTGGKAWNQLTGNITAARGNVTIAGLAVNQDGRVSATTTVSANGSIRLLGRDTMALTTEHGRTIIGATRGGSVTLGAGSTTAVTPELEDKATAVDDQAQNPSSVLLSGKRLAMEAGASIVAPGGDVEFLARGNPSVEVGDDREARIRIARNAVIDVSGSTASAAVERNLVTVELRANELRDSPLQRDGALRGKPLVVDARVGTPLGDVSGALANLPRDIAERTSAGGTVRLQSQGDVAIERDALIDVSGGVINYRPGIIQTTQLVGENGQVVDIGRADPNVVYTGIVNPTWTRSFERWGVKETLQGPQIGHYDPGYTEGRPAGTLSIEAPAMALNGRFEGQTTRGLYQRDPATLPAGGQFVLGITGGSRDADNPDFRAPSVTLINGLSNVVVGGDGSLPGNVPLELSTDFMTRGGFTRVELNSNGTFKLAADTPLHLPAGSSLSVRARDIDVRSDIVSTGGSIKLAAGVTAGIPGGINHDPSVTLGEGVTLDVRGNWQNDLLDPVGAIFRNGGSIDIAALSYPDATARLTLGDDVRLRVSGGARLQANGAVQGGTGGSISLRAPNDHSDFAIGERVELDAFGVQGARGGSLTLESRRIDIGNGGHWAEAQGNGSGGDPGSPQLALELGSALFDSYGFNTFNLTATGPVHVAPLVPPPQGPTEALGPQPENQQPLRVLEGTRIDARASTRQLSGVLALQANADSVEAFTRTLLLPEYQQNASTMNLRVDPRDFPPTGGDLGRLQVGRDTLITGAPRSVFSFTSPGGIDFAGQIYSMGGTIRANVPTPARVLDPGYDPALRIELHDTAVLDVSGGTVFRPSDSGLRLGDVIAGGTVELLAERGSVFVDPGASIDVSGAAAELDLRSGTSAGTYQRQVVTSNAGTLRLRAPESILLAGNIRGDAGEGSALRATGGLLDITLSRSAPFSPGDAGPASTYPTHPRELRLIPDSFAGTPSNGVAVLEADKLQNSGFDALRLDTDGVLRLDAGLELSFARSLTLDTAVLDVAPGAPVKLSAEYVALGSTRALAESPVATGGAGRLEVHGELVDLIGEMALRRAGELRIDSGGDIRLRGTAKGSALPGNLFAMGHVELSAARIYPTTGSQFGIVVDPAGSGMLRISSDSVHDQVPLSAGGSVALRAHDIEQGGNLLAPFGQIRFDATDSVKLLPGSVTSTAAVDALIPLGHVEQSRWLYTQGNQQSELTAIPMRSVEISAPDVDIAQGSTLDLRGGGDLYSYQWLPGTGGSRDVLSNAAGNGYFAILPGAGPFAPFDPEIYAGSTLQPGNSVYLSGGAGLAAGTYALLPARYALLPGAYLVRAVSGYTDLPPDQAARLTDGTPVLSGYRTFGNSGVGDSRYGGFAVLDSAAVRKLANYQDFKASTFFAARAARLEQPRPILPADAGHLGLFVTDSLALDGTVRTGGAKDGVSASIDVSALRLEIGGSSATPREGTVRLDANTITGWNASSLLLGGRRSADGTSIEVLADEVALGPGVQLHGSEVMLAANQAIYMASGSVLQADDKQGELVERQIALSSGAASAAPAMLAVSSRNRFDIQRNANGADDAFIDLGLGSRVVSGGSALIDVPGGATLNGSFSVAGADVAFVSRDLLFANQTVEDSLTLRPVTLAGLDQAATLRFTARNSIEFRDSTTLGSAAAPLAQLIFDTPLLSAAGDSVAVNIYAHSIGLAGSQQPGVGGAAGTASFDLEADQIDFLGGTLSLGGIEHARLLARSAILGVEDSELRTSGALDVTAGVLVSATGKRLGFTVDGDARFERTSTAAIPEDAGIGGMLDISARNLEFAGSALLPSGAVTLAAQEQLTLGDGASIDVSGVSVTHGGRTLASPGGSISLAAGTDLTAHTGSHLSLDGGTAAAGNLWVRADGQVDFGSTLSAQGAGGGTIQIDGANLGDFAALAARIESGGFGERRELHARSGDFVMPATMNWSARHMSLATDAGVIDIAGNFFAESSNERSTLELYAGNGLTLRTGARLSATSASGLGRGGDLVLSTTGGSIDLQAGSRIDVRGTREDGSVLLRAPAIAGAGVAIDRIASTFDSAGEVVIEPTLRFDNAPETINTGVLNGYYNSATTFFNAAIPAIKARLTAPGGPALRVQPGLDIRRDGDLSISAFDFRNWRFAGSPGAVNFRATGSIDVNGNLSDGFSFTGTGDNQRINLLDTRSSTLRLVAGADLAGASLAATNRGSGDLRLNALVRTGTGDITLAAAHDIQFLGAGSGVYTGGLAGSPTIPIQQGPFMLFPTGGGSLSLRAGNDVIGNAVDDAQLPLPLNPADWQLRQGSELAPGTKPGWGIDARRFGWNAGTLGGGDLSVRAGHDVNNLSAAAADSGIVENGVLRKFGGGVLSIDAGHDIGSAFVHVTAGDNAIRAANSLSSSRPGLSGDPLGSLFSIEDASVSISARDDIRIESMFNPTMLAQPFAPPDAPSFFFTYGPNSAFRATTVAGTLNMSGNTTGVASFITNETVSANALPLALYMFAPTLELASLSEDLDFSGTPWMFPSANGNLSLFAGRDIKMLGALSMSDISMTALPTVLRPSSLVTSLDELQRVTQALHHVTDTEPVRVNAGRDIISGQVSASKFAQVEAGRDIRDFSLVAQNLRDTDQSRIVAGRDVTLVDTGSIFEVGGPGRLDILAGRDIDLGFSKGISTTGRLKNPLLSASGASITAIAGFDQALGVDPFIDDIVLGHPENAKLLLEYMRKRTGMENLDQATAVARFRQLDAEAQRPLLVDVFFSELVFAGREANRDPASNFARGYAAIDALFEHSRDPDPDGTPGFENPYSGNLTLAFSRIYTLGGGDINLLVPGGIVDVGLAVPPAVGAPPRNPSDLGIVAQRAGSVRIYSEGDVLVNQSRVFTLAGGDIAIWSTLGDIDAGRGAKSAISAPAPQVVVDPSGNVTVDLAGAVAGSGIRGILTDPDIEPGDVDLIAPSGIVNAGDAGIGAAGNLNVAAQQVVGLDNIQVGGTSTGVPAETSNLGATLSAVSASSSAATSSATKDAGDAKPQTKSALADAALGWLDVFLEGFGDEVCKAADEECLKRQQSKN